MLGVMPWRISNTKVGGGGLRRADVAMSSGQHSVWPVHSNPHPTTPGHPATPGELASRGEPATPGDPATIEELTARIVDCRACPRLVAWREAVAASPRAAFRGEAYWGRPVPGFGDHRARILVVGLAPAAHGGNRTGRVFTGDRSGDWLFAALYRAGLANQPTSRSSDDGLVLRDVYVAAVLRCAPPANRPTTEERDRCLPYLARELELLTGVRVLLALGQFAYDACCRLLGVRPRPRFAHGAAVTLGAAGPAGAVGSAGAAGALAGRNGMSIVCSFHPSQQNTFTGRLTEAMLDQVCEQAVGLAGVTPAFRPAR